ncbi:hypothetical protein [Paraclostridium sordellii]|uniref:hypothetical protein n=1 Tax=Paraclostridium sordellii TaxID=1505 RepID=UPI0005E69E7F|nr:hypothetical protein [Paeniclostridium sordellii]CEO30407.1 Uncharacterised protein [[Clostridium] sordellii] [Paeniclostridium sordellii]CEP39144.1 Uncharacterised protein [[Clostridium] sordellii] [Paeniclostridium sordellii]CEP48945.1 Uncharacterised protein [[Clostridium] sordellii] [Paeniclostridium sordellii]
MKKKLIGDILVYFISPIVLCSLIKGQNKIYSIIIITMIGIGYSIIVRYSQYRVNISAIIFLSIYTIIQSPKISLNDNYYIYVYDIYCLILTSIFLIITNLLDKNIFKLFYIDALKILNYTNNQILNTIKRNNLYREFYKITSILNIHILTIILVKTHAAISLGKVGYLTSYNMEVFISVIFILAEIIIAISIIKKIKPILDGRNLKNMKFIKSDTRVINFEKYRNLNK